MEIKQLSFFNKNWLKTNLVLIVFFWVVLVPLVQATSLKNNTVKLQLFWHHQFEFAGFYAAIEQGYFDKYNIKVELIKFDPEIDTTEAVLNGEAHFGLAGTELIEQYHQGKDVILLANYFKSSPLTIITQPEITSLKQLSDKKVYGNSHQMQQGGIRSMLNLYGVKSSKIDLTMEGDAISLFESNKIAGILAYRTNMLYELKLKNIEYKLFDPNQFGLVSQDLNLFTSNTFAKKNPELVDKFVLAVNEGWQFALKNTATVINLIQSKYNLQDKTKEQLKFEALVIKKLMSPELFSIGSIQRNKLIAISEESYTNQSILKIRNLDDFIFQPIKKRQIDPALLKLLTEQEKYYLKTHSTLTIQNESDYPPFNYSVSGSPVGYSIDFVNTLAEKMGISIQFMQNKSWQDYLSLLSDNQLDAMINIMKTEKRKKIYNFTTPFAEPNNVAVTRENDTDKLINEASLKNKKLVVVEGYAASDKYKKLYPAMKVIKVKNVLAALKKVRTQEADIFISNDAVIRFYIEKHYITGLKFISLSKELEYPNTLLSIATNITNPTLRNIFQKAMSTISEHETLALRKKWFGKLKNNNLVDLELTQAEKDYLEKNTTLRVQNDGNYPPFTYLSNGKPTGYSVELLYKIADLLEVNLKFSENKEWSEYLTMLEKKELDMMINIIDTKSRRRFASFTKPYAEISTMAVIRKDDITSIVTEKDLTDRIIVITSGYAINESLKKSFPTNTFKEVNNTNEALKLISLNQADIYFEAGAVLHYYITTSFMSELEVLPIAPNMGMMNQDFSLATNKDNPILLSILQKSLNAISDIDHLALKRKWLGESNQKTLVNYDFSPDELNYINDKEVILCRPELADGSKFTIELIDFIMRPTGLSIKISRPLSWAESLIALKNKECDLLASATNTPERQKTMAFTEEYFRDKIVILTKKDKNEIYDITDHLTDTFATIKGLSVIKLLKKKHPNIKLIEVDTPLHGLTLVQKEQAFGFIYPQVFTSNLFDRFELSDLKINHSLRRQYDDIQAIATRKNEKLLHSILYKSVGNTNKTALAKLIHSKSASKMKVNFNKYEEEYISSQKVTWCYSDNAYAWQELMSYLTHNTEMNLVKSKKMSWHEAIAALNDGKCDVLPEATETVERRKIMNFTKPIHQEERVIVTLNQQSFIADIRDHLNKTFVLHKGDVVIEQLKDGFPELKTVLVEHQREGLNLVKDGEAFAYIGSISDTGSNINKFSLDNLKIAGTLSDKYNDSWALATRKNDKVLASIFSKLVDHADTNKIRKIISGQISVKYEKGFDYTLFWQMLIIACIILTAILFWNRHLAALNLQLQISKKSAEKAQKKVESQNREILETQEQLVLSEKMASLGTLTAGVAHEINNPTNFTHAAVFMMQNEIKEIKDFLKLLAGGDKADAELVKSFDTKFEKLIELTKTATEGTQRIKIIVEDLRTFARLDGAKQAEIRVSELIKATSHLVQTQYENITIKTDFTDDPLIMCYPSKLNQVFMNVIVNACQSINTKLKRNHQLNSKNELEGLININTVENDNYLVIQINDNGCGMDRETQQKVCEPFFTTKDVGSGTGLGMAISFGIIEEHDGMLKISSTLSKGSDFSIFLPIQKNSPKNRS